MERVMVTLPSDLLQTVDAMAQRRGRKRSPVVREALQEWIERQRREEFEALLAEGYRSLATETSAIVEDSEWLQASAAEHIWRWDD